MDSVILELIDIGLRITQFVENNCFFYSFLKTPALVYNITIFENIVFVCSLGP